MRGIWVEQRRELMHGQQLAETPFWQRLRLPIDCFKFSESDTSSPIPPPLKAYILEQSCRSSSARHYCERFESK